MKQYRDTSEKVDTHKTGGRPKLDEYDQRTHHHKVSFNDEEEAIVQMKAEDDHVKDSKYLHDIALNGVVYARLSDESTDMLRDICGIANNTNQIAHSANAAGFHSVRFLAEDLLKKLHELIRRILRGGDLSEPTKGYKDV